MNKRKVVTLCGSIKFCNKMQKINERLELENGYFNDINPTVTKSNNSTQRLK